MKSKWVWFRFDGMTQSGKTKLFCVMTQGDDTALGIIKWYGPWRKYIFDPFLQTVFEQDCLRDIAGFLDELMQERKDVHEAPDPTDQNDLCEHGKRLCGCRNVTGGK